jgi:hypothetical protein
MKAMTSEVMRLSAASPRNQAQAEHMERYKNLSGHSGVVAYEIESDAIRVAFKDGCVYVYTYASAGVSRIETMKGLARVGRGLSTYIARNVREAYESKHQ